MTTKPEGASEPVSSTGHTAPDIPNTPVTSTNPVGALPPILNDAVEPKPPTFAETFGKKSDWSAKWKASVASAKSAVKNVGKSDVKKVPKATPADEAIFGHFFKLSSPPVGSRGVVGRGVIIGLVLIMLLLIFAWVWRAEIASSARATTQWISSLFSRSEPSTVVVINTDQRQSGSVVPAASAPVAVPLASGSSAFGPDGKPSGSSETATPQVARAPVAASAPTKVVGPEKVAKADKPKVVTKVIKVPPPAKQDAAPALSSTPKVAEVESPKATAAPIAIAEASPKPPTSSKLFRWTKVGGDPCNPKVGCTLEWALDNTGWPGDVQLALLAAVKGSSPETITITSGLGGSKGPTWSGWMTWGKYQPKFEMNTVAAWPSGQHEPASLWAYESGGTKYNLIKVRKCGNWGGWTQVLHQKPEPVHMIARAAPQQSQPGMMPLDPVPVVVCIDE